MPRAPRRLALLLLAFAALLPCVAGAGVFELQVLEFSNYRLQRAGGACCAGAAAAGAGATGGAGGAGAARTCASPCRTKFALCLKEYQPAAARGSCSFGHAVSPVLGTDSFTLTEPLYTLALPFSFRWTRSFTLILEAYDDFEYPDPDSGLIETAWWSGIVEPGAAWHALRHAGSAAAVAYRVRVLCAANYYNATCTTFCRARDDKFGHYSCDDDGRKRCLPGWHGDNCETPICKEGCHPTHGHCERPGECDCRPGWRGELCSQCQAYPGCKHGYCNGSAWDCTCDTNWGGILCDQDLNYCGTHEPCQNGGTCENTAPDQYLCTCADGFSGAECERVDNPCAPQPCQHGACELAAAAPGYVCRCAPGWAGPACERDEDDCASAPCRHGACRDLVAGYACECAAGWTGAACDQDVDECAAASPCVNAAACSNAPGGYSCTCLAGWSGRDCDVNVDDCTGQCLNGATCIDLVDDFHCACAAGYAGPTCARDVDECASRPCRNGGECVDLLDAYRCICPVGYSGHDCELAPCLGRYCSDDRDHCASAPCGNGAACYTAQSDYYCHCARGWAGKDCTVRAPLQLDECDSSPCRNNGTCVSGPTNFTCVCRDGWTGKTCDGRVENGERCGDVTCLNGGTCVLEGGVARCAGAGGAGAAGPAGAAPDGCGGCAHGGVCAGGVCSCAAGWAGAHCDLPDACAARPCARGRCVAGAGWWACRCPPGWAGAACDEPACSPACSLPARCEPGARGPRCACPDRSDPPCFEADEASPTDEALTWSEAGGCGENGTRWWGCNVCACGACSRLWCGLPDCLAPRAAACRADEVCVPAAPALCLRPPCAAPGECRRVAGRRVEPPALPAPPACWPGAAAGTDAPPGCVRARLLLARERLLAGAHVERACGALRRVLAAATAARPAPLTLLCDLPPQDDDALDLALWAGEEEGAAAAAERGMRALAELVARRRLPQHPLLGAALALRLTPAGGGAHTAAWAALGAAVVLAAAAAAAGALWLRRHRAAAAGRARCDEEKSNNLQNEENLRRFANPLREPAPRDPYKARNTAPPAPRDKELSTRALPPPAPAPAPAPPPPERLTLVV